jgi:hypothetical protein
MIAADERETSFNQISIAILSSGKTEQRYASFSSRPAQDLIVGGQRDLSARWRYDPVAPISERIPIYGDRY